MVGGLLFIRENKRRKTSNSLKMECDFYEIDISTQFVAGEYKPQLTYTHTDTEYNRNELVIICENTRDKWRS